MNVFSSRKEWWLVCFFSAYCAYYLAISLSVAWGFTTDDAFISWQYARQLVQGQGLYWQHAMPAVEGYSNFLWVMISALIIKMQWPLVLTIKWVSVASLLLGLFFLYRLSRLFVSPLLAILPVFIFSHYSGVVWWTVSGLESTFFCMLSLLFIWQGARALGYGVYSAQATAVTQGTTAAWIIANSTLFLLGLTRFEGVIWAVPLIFFVVCQIRKQGINRLPKGRTTLYVWGLISLVCFILPYLVYSFWRIHYFGHWIPNSYRCKALASGQIGIVDLDYIRVVIALIVASLPCLVLSKDCRHLLLWLPSLLYGLMLWKADPLLAYYLRFFLAPFALLSLLAVLGVYQFLQQIHVPKLDLKLITCFCIVLLTFLFIPGDGLNILQAHVSEYQGRNQNRLMITQILNEHASKDAVVLLDDCGMIPFHARTDLRFIDSQCLNNRDLAQAINYNELGAYADYVQKQIQPQWVVMNQFAFMNHLNLLMDALAKKQFLRDYQLFATLRSRIAPNDPLAAVDHYLVYKRKHDSHQAKEL